MQPISFIFIHPTIPHPNTGQYSRLRISHQGQESILLLLRHPSYTTRNCVVTTVHRAVLKSPFWKKWTTPQATMECGNNLISQKIPQMNHGLCVAGGRSVDFTRSLSECKGNRKPGLTETHFHGPWLSSVLFRHFPSITSLKPSRLGPPQLGTRSPTRLAETRLSFALEKRRPSRPVTRSAHGFGEGGAKRSR